MIKKMLFVMLSVTLIASILGGCPFTDNPGQKDKNYTIEEGFRFQQSISGFDFDLRLPKVTHSKNSEIGAFYDRMIENQNLMISRWESGEIDLTDPEAMIYTYPEADYEIREAKGLVTVLVAWEDLFGGITFDNDGKIYTDEELLALYGMTREQADEAILVSVDGVGYYYNDIESCNIYSEDTLLCVAINGGDLAHGYLLTSTGGAVTAVPYFTLLYGEEG